MLENLITIGLLCASNTPLKAPAPTYVIDNQSNTSMRVVYRPTGNPTIIEPYTEFTTTYSLNNYYIDNNNNDLYYFAFAVDGEHSRWLKQDIDSSDNYKFEPIAGDTKVTIRNASYNGTFYMDFNYVSLDPFSETFYYLTGLNASNYSSLGTGTIVRPVRLGQGGSFTISTNLNLDEVPNANKIPYTDIWAMYSVSLRNGVYSPSNVKVTCSFIATHSTNHKALAFAGNFPAENWKYSNFVIEGTTYNIYAPTGAVNETGPFRNYLGTTNQLTISNVTIYNDNQARFFSYKTLINPTYTQTNTTEILNDIFVLLSLAFNTLFPFFAIMVFPGVTIGLLICIPLFVSLLIAIFKLIKK